MRRPDNIAEVAEWSESSREFHYHIADFLDHFRMHPDATRLEKEPALLRERFERGEICDAYIAAVALSLAREIKAAPPRWVWQERRKLRRPWFASEGPAIRAMLLWESPAPFRERNLFVSANALSRA
jgi:hypothetical protein